MSTSRGSIEQRSNGTFRVVYRYGGKRHRSPTFSSRDLARAFQDTLAGDVARGIEYDPAGPKTPFEVYAERWFGSRLRNVDVAQSRARERSFLDVHLIPRWGAVQIGAIRRIEVQSWVNELAAKRKPRTVRDILQVFGQILRDAAADGLLPAGSPVGGNMIKLPKVAADDDHQVLEHEELEHLLAIAEDSWPAEYPAIRVLSDTGMRLGELFALQDIDINFDEGWLEVSESLKKQGNGRYVRGTRSKSARRRRVDLWPETLEVLDAKRRTQRGDLVFAGPDGSVMNLDNWRSRHWAKVVKSAGFPDLTPHDLRHTHATHLLDAGADAVVVAARLGHSSTKMVLDVYAHALPGRQPEILEQLKQLRSLRKERAATDSHS